MAATIGYLSTILATHKTPTSPQPTLLDIEAVILGYYGISLHDLLKIGDREALTEPRAMAYWLACNMTRIAVKDIAAHFHRAAPTICKLTKRTEERAEHYYEHFVRVRELVRLVYEETAAVIPIHARLSRQMCSNIVAEQHVGGGEQQANQDDGPQDVLHWRNPGTASHLPANPVDHQIDDVKNDHCDDDGDGKPHDAQGCNGHASCQAEHGSNGHDQCSQQQRTDGNLSHPREELVGGHLVDGDEEDAARCQKGDQIDHELHQSRP